MPTLSTAQKITVFLIIDIPWTDSGYTITDGVGTIRTAGTINPSAVIKPEIEAFLDAISADVYNAIVSLINDWDAMGTNTARMEGGQLGDMSGVTQLPNEKRALIRERMRNLVPFWQSYVLLQKQAGQQQSFVPMIS
jgi:hypothetical protein